MTTEPVDRVRLLEATSTLSTLVDVRNAIPVLNTATRGSCAVPWGIQRFVNVILPVGQVETRKGQRDTVLVQADRVRLQVQVTQQKPHSSNKQKCQGRNASILRSKKNEYCAEVWLNVCRV